MKYTLSQKSAIETIGQNLQIIACAGSGKTQVISARVVEILKKCKGVKPGNIVAFTFTDKAAGELKDRIHKLCLDELGTDLGLAEMFVGTIHGYCLGLLQSPPLYKYLKYNVLSDIQQRLLIDRHSKQSGLTMVPLQKGGTLKRWLDSRLYQSLLGILREGDINTRLVPKGVKEASKMYETLMHDKKYLDYTQIIHEAVFHVKNNKELRKKIASEIKFLVVDEYQDVNPLQETLVSEIHKLGANICVVGDDDQTIYQWRGSDVENIIRFNKRYPKVKQIPQNENFRSNIAIVNSASLVIANNDPDRLPKKMICTNAQPFSKGDLLALTFKNPEEEAKWIVQKIKRLYGTPYRDKKDDPIRGLCYSDFSILLRSVRNDASPIVQALDREKIPYVVGGMNGLFDTAEVQAIRSVFYFLSDYSLPTGQIDQKSLGLLLKNAKLGLSNSQITNGIKFLEKRKLKISDRLDAELYLQRLYLDFLEALGIREENIESDRGKGKGEIVYFNLGKFSQVISDFEHIHFHTSPIELYKNFSDFLFFQAPEYYPEGWEDKGIARPDAVQIMTVHQAKGMQWPAVFVPCLRKNRFPSRRQGGRSVWHVIPKNSVKNVSRYEGTIEDERRLFYVAMTRAEKYLFCSWAPISTNRQQRAVSPFFQEFTSSEYVLTKEISESPTKTEAKPKKEITNFSLTFSELKYYFECPYLFKLRFLYGFDTPINRALGYGKSLHDALAEIHSESLKGNIPKEKNIPKLVESHLHLPFANIQVRKYLLDAGIAALKRYLKEHSSELNKLEHVEKIVELKLKDGVVVHGRIDLIRRTDTNETVIVDFKSDEKAQAEEISQRQLHVYAVGYEKLTGKMADLIEIHNLDKGGAIRETVDKNLIDGTLKKIVEAGKNLRESNLPRLPANSQKCSVCDHVGICREREKPTAGKKQ